MKPLLDSIRALKTTFANIFRPPVTVEFPIVIRPRGERFRASFALPDDENGEMACVACLSCEKICPSQVIKVKSAGKRESPVTGKKRQYADEFTLDLSACIQCELCVQVCNSDAIVMVREPEVPTYRREDLVLDIEKLRANAKERHAAWGKGTNLQEMQDSKPKGEAKAADGAADEKPAAEAKPKPAPKPKAEKPAPKAEPKTEATAAPKPAETAAPESSSPEKAVGERSDPSSSSQKAVGERSDPSSDAKKADGERSDPVLAAEAKPAEAKPAEPVTPEGGA